MRPVVKAPPMPRAFRHALVSVRDLAVTAGPFALLALALLALLPGCAMQPWVKPYERERLADPVMQLSRGALAD